MRRLSAFLSSMVYILTCVVVGYGQQTPLRAPSVPLVACDPYFSIWSPHDHLSDGDTTHWTGRSQRLECQLLVDGKALQIHGRPEHHPEVLPQTSVVVAPTSTVCHFAGSGIALKLTFFTPALPDDLSILSRPVTYVIYELAATDGKEHEVKIDFVVRGEVCVNTTSQKVLAESIADVPGLAVLRVGSVDQQVLAKSGDDMRIDWGHFYLAAPKDIVTLAQADKGHDATLPSLHLQLQAGKVGASPVTRWLMLAYDDEYAMQYMKKNLRPYWRKDGWTAKELLTASAKEFDSLRARGEKFDKKLLADCEKVGGANYAALVALAYRQCFAAGKFVADANGQPLQFSKENHSNGCVATSDVFYPMAPQFLFFGPSLAKSFIVPFMNYAASERWKFPFAPHDLGTYPHANGQVYGGGERTEENQMPVEETGNLMILFGAVAEMEGHADFAGLYWPQLTKWAAYLKDKGFDPENQLCTDDFAGHLAHNVNLSAKAICALGSFAKLCEMRGDTKTAKEYSTIAKQFAQRWVKEADAGDHTRLAFDRPDSWSQKYNLVWDRILGLGLFPDEVRTKEMAFYRKTQNTYGLPLDNRKDYTKLDWILWTATLTQQRDDFDALLAPVIKFINETPDRVPLTDWYETKTPRRVGFTARPVIGGVFLQLLYQKDLWKGYASQDQTKAAKWAKLPKPPLVRMVIPTAETEAGEWEYTFEKPADGWEKVGFDSAAWQRGKGGFGTAMTPGAVVGTEWKTSDIWLRRRITLPANTNREKLQLMMHHDDDVKVYFNGVSVVDLGGFTANYQSVPLNSAARKELAQGEVTIAIHCKQEAGGQYIDLGFAEITEQND